LPGLRNALSSATQLALHVVGDVETERVLTVMENRAPAAAWRVKRVRLEHGNGLGPRLRERAARLGVVVIQNPTHLPSPPKDGVTDADPLLHASSASSRVSATARAAGLPPISPCSRRTS
jgi:predicted amidohydrolase YtcJ